MTRGVRTVTWEVSAPHVAVPAAGLGSGGGQLVLPGVHFAALPVQAHLLLGELLIRPVVERPQLLQAGDLVIELHLQAVDDLAHRRAALVATLAPGSGRPGIGSASGSPAGGRFPSQAVQTGQPCQRKSAVGRVLYAAGSDQLGDVRVRAARLVRAAEFLGQPFAVQSHLGRGFTQRVEQPPAGGWASARR
jgi:hypothetical protein